MSIDSARQFALRLHSLSAADREWILSRLAPDARERLAPLLEELVALGLRIDPQMLAEIAEKSRNITAATGNHAQSYQDDLKLLNRANPQWVATVLAEEPAALRNCIDAACHWAWRAADGGANAETDIRVRARANPHHLGPTQRVRQTLIAELAKKMRADHRRQGATPGASSTFAPKMSAEISKPARKRWWAWSR